jgi:GntR family transcriptional regulator
MYSIACLSAGQPCFMVITMAGDHPTFDAASPIPIYVQIADYVAGQVASGHLKKGSRLPAERDLAEQWGVAYLTVRRAMRELRERGLVTSVVGKGTFINGDQGQ